MKRTDHPWRRAHRAVLLWIALAGVMPFTGCDAFSVEGRISSDPPDHHEAIEPPDTGPERREPDDE